MQKTLLITLVSALFFFSSCIASKSGDHFFNDLSKMVYGKDDRVEVADFSDKIFQEYANSVAGMVRKEQLIPIENSQEELFELDGASLIDRLLLCPSEKFATQKGPMKCTGLLIGPKTLLTAGHCAIDPEFCENSAWIFNYTDENGENIKAKDIFFCKKLLSPSMTSELDYALIELDRLPVGRHPLEYRKSGNITEGEELVIIGHPDGVPLKIANNASVRSNELDSTFFVANLDSFDRNSGSPVFNSVTKKVEGILVRGDDDYVWDSIKECFVANQSEKSGGRGEDVQKIVNIMDNFEQK